MSIGRHTAYNLAGAAVPIVIGLVTVPAYLHVIGGDRYGVLSIAWLILGYFGLFDLGLGRATAQRMAALQGDSPVERANIFWMAVSLNLAMGLVGMALLWPAGWYFFAHSLKTSDALRGEALAALPLLAASVPLATTMGVLTGALQARSRFLEINVASVVTTTLLQVSPLCVALLWGPNLLLLIGAAFTSRVVALLYLWWQCSKHVISGAPFRLDRTQSRHLLSYGGWVTLAAFFGPILVIVDRFVIGTMLGALAVALYTIPFQLAQRISIIPTALTTALFPRLAAERDGGAQLEGQAIAALLTIMTPIVMGIILVMSPFFELWVGHAVAEKAALVGKVIALGYWANALALVPFSTLQARGRPDLVAYTLLLQVLPYLIGLYLGLRYGGLVGAAAAFSIRCLVDYFLLSLASGLQTRPVVISAALAALVGATVLSERLIFPAPAWWLAAVACFAASLVIAAIACPPVLAARLPQSARLRALFK